MRSTRDFKSSYSDSFKESNVYKIKNVKLIKLIKIILAVVLFCLIVSTSLFFIFKHQTNQATVKNIKKAWNSNYDYQKVYELSKEFLQNKPFNNTALIYYSYACFFLSQSQIENQKAQEYLDECINSLRIALYDSKKSVQPQIYYMLGKAYFYKNTITSHYYSDLAVKYLLLAKENGYVADDIPEYLGLSYTALGMTMESIAAFSEALLIRESDSLLLSIAEQYYKANEMSAAKQYLFRVINDSKNDEIIIKSRIQLGNIYIAEQDYESALNEFNFVLEKAPNSADAHYGIGVIYEKQGNIVKARAEWRNTLKLQINHSGALQKMSEN